MSVHSINRPQRRSRSRRRTLLAVALLAIVIILLAYAFLRNAQNSPATPPAGYEPVAEVDLSARPYEAETLAQFSLEERAMVGVFYALPNVDAAYFDLRLIGGDGQAYLILHSEDFRTDRDGGGLWEENLPPGTYRLQLTAQQSAGTLSVYGGWR